MKMRSTIIGQYFNAKRFNIMAEMYHKNLDLASVTVGELADGAWRPPRLCRTHYGLHRNWGHDNVAEETMDRIYVLRLRRDTGYFMGTGGMEILSSETRIRAVECSTNLRGTDWVN
jgi:hypothetical protein